MKEDGFKNIKAMCFYHLIHFSNIFEPKFFKGMSLTIYFHDKSAQIKNMLWKGFNLNEMWKLYFLFKGQ